jgi:hypothetical protein
MGVGASTRSRCVQGRTNNALGLLARKRFGLRRRTLDRLAALTTQWIFIARQSPV